MAVQFYYVVGVRIVNEFIIPNSYRVMEFHGYQ